MIKFGKVEKQFQYKGHDCIIVFTHWGVRNGYVSVTEDKDYTEYDIDCHGGLTFSGKLPYDYGQKKLYYIGFDCGHICDANNYDLAYEYGLIDAETRDRRKADYFYKDATERTLEYVEQECKKIVDQLKAQALKQSDEYKIEVCCGEDFAEKGPEVFDYITECLEKKYGDAEYIMFGGYVKNEQT